MLNKKTNNPYKQILIKLMDSMITDANIILTILEMFINHAYEFDIMR